MVDQLGAKWLEAAFEGVVPLPHLDRLRRMGTSFSRTVTSNPVCTPTRATLATGLTSRQHGVIENGYVLDPALPTFMRALQEAGYRTGAAGKIHVRPHWESAYPDYHPYGFDVVHSTEDDRGGQWLDWVMEHHPDQLENVLATVWAPEMPAFEKYGPDQVNLGERIREIRRTFPWATPEFPLSHKDAFALPFPEEISQTNWTTDRGIEFLRSCPPDQPFFAQISYVQPHLPFCAPGPYFERVDTERIPEPLPPEWKDDPHAPEYFKQLQGGIPDDWKWQRHCYFADLAHLDAQLGRVLDELEDSDRLENTFILFLSDHGEMLHDHGTVGKETKHYDACIRVPLIIAGPGLARGKVSDEWIQLEDICPTILDLAGTRLPPLPNQGTYMDRRGEDLDSLPGQSLLPLCRGDTPARSRTAAYSENYNPIAHYQYPHWVRTIRTREFRYSYYAGGGGEQLFDLRSDSDELHNRAADPDYRDIKHDLRLQLMEFIIAQDFPKPRRNLFSLGVH